MKMFVYHWQPDGTSNVAILELSICCSVCVNACAFSIVSAAVCASVCLCHVFIIYEELKRDLKPINLRSPLCLL